MIFERPWVLVFLLLPLAWAWFEWRHTRRVIALVLKTLSFLAIILALAEPTLTVPETKMAVAVLVDTSASVSPQDLTRASEFASALDKARGQRLIFIRARGDWFSFFKNFRKSIAVWNRRQELRHFRVVIKARRRRDNPRSHCLQYSKARDPALLLSMCGVLSGNEARSDDEVRGPCAVGGCLMC